MKRLAVLVLLLLALAAAAAAWAWQRWHAPLPLAAEVIEHTIAPGSSPAAIARGWVQAGVKVDPRWLQWGFRLSGRSTQLRAGSYAVSRGTSAADLLQVLRRGDETLLAVRLIEGWTLAQARAALARADGLRETTAGLSETELMTRVGAPAGQAAEGRFFPDTYRYHRGVSDLTVLRQAYGAMQSRLAAEWAQRAADSPLRDADELLKLASIVEKETAREADRGLVAGVFSNRLRIGMRLQTDPTVIYGLGPAFDGNLRRRDLETDTPFNSYTRAGLPPTPIALPGGASLRAAAQPTRTRALYFVARGDGSSEFSETLAAHNRAVDRYQR